ncbi:putative POGO family transposase [Ixodes scapularis]
MGSCSPPRNLKIGVAGAVQNRVQASTGHFAKTLYLKKETLASIVAGTTTARDNSGLVECSDCGRWVFLDKMPFKSLKETEAVQYVCTLRTKVKATQKVLTQAVKCKREETELRAVLQEEIYARKQMEAELRENLEEEKTATRKAKTETTKERAKREEGERCLAEERLR